METKKAKTKVATTVLALAGLLVFSLFAVGGSLEPSGPPAPTMKTLDEVEPRVPIHAADLPLTISEPNSYYLAEDVDFTSTANDAITIECNDVTIDLMGYTLKGPGPGARYGIYMYGRTNVEIRNGTVRDFWYGIYEGSSWSQHHRVIDVRAISNARSGIYLYGKSHLVKDCTASDNGTSATMTVYGIYARYGSTVTGNRANNNGNGASGPVYGIYTYPLSTVTGNTANYNGDSATGSTVYGIRADGGCTVTGNTACKNGYSASGSVWGIYLGGNNLVDQNIAYNNGGVNMNNPGNCTFGTNHAP